MPPPQPRRYFRVRRRSDNTFFFLGTQRFEERGSKMGQRELLQTLRRLSVSQDNDDIEVIRYDVVVYPPRPMLDVLKRMEEARSPRPSPGG